jgi:2-polyprenyl-6-methoxyphenol hydroxylase-like FAD-dependent oxidoreductase
VSYDTHVCIAGGGPGGMILALLLGRAGIPTTLFEEHENFERDFRGDTVHTSTMELMDALGLADRLLELPHAKIHRLGFDTPSGPVVMADLTRIRSKFPYITMMPQARFLDFLAEEMSKLPSVRLVMGAAVHGLLWEDPWGLSGIADRPPEREAEAGAAEAANGQSARPKSPPAPPAPGHGPLPEDATVRGVHYRTRTGQHDVRAPLTIAADGRFSRVRRLAGFELESSAPPMDVVWFRLPRRPTDPEDAQGKIGNGHLLVILNRGDEWQIAYVIPKGTYREIRAAGLPAFRQTVAEMAPELADRVDALQDWHEMSLLSVESGRIRRWYRPGLLLIGDAAHVMSPVGGVGINYAIQDAVVAANVLTDPLRRGRLRLRDLAEVQRQREIPIRIIQGIQRLIQERVVTQALKPGSQVQPPPIVHVPVLRDLFPRMLAKGVWPVHLKSPAS